MSKRSKMTLFCRGKGLCVSLAFIGILFSCPALSGVRQPDVITAVVWQYPLAALTSSDAARLVERKTGGKVLAVSEEERGGKRVYRIKVLLPEGRIRTLFIDRDSGIERGS